MSGGEWDYDQRRMEAIASDLRAKALNNGWLDSDARKRLLKAAEVVAEAALRTQRADWFVSDDDGLEQYVEREEAELREMRLEHARYRAALRTILGEREESK